MSNSLPEFENVLTGPWDTLTPTKSSKISYDPSNQGTAESPIDSIAGSISYEASTDVPKEVSDKSGNQSPVGNSDHLIDIKSLNMTQLRAKYPKEYKDWDNMKQRCRRLDYKLHPEFKKFTGFLACLGPRPDPSYTVDRIDPSNPEYGPGTVRYAPKQVQTENRGMTGYLTDIDGTRLSLPEWARRTKTNPSTMRSRKSNGWPDHEVIHDRQSTPTASKLSNMTRKIYAEWNGFVTDADEAERAFRKDSKPREMRIAWLFRHVMELVNSGKEDRQCLREIYKMAEQRYGTPKAEGFMEVARRRDIACYPPTRQYSQKWWEDDYNISGENDGGELDDTDSYLY